jgi:3-hydroxyisobutyrate dehydrogenase-like beta-hydroxyacid dehydrogenase
VKVGFIGLGKMGSGMAACLQRQGHDVIVHDTYREAAEPHLEAGASWADSPARLAGETRFVLTSLPGPAEVEAVVLGADGLVQGVRPGTTVVDLSTNSPELLQRLERLLAERGAHLLDAPVSGGPHGARAGTLAVWVGGAEETFQAARPVLEGIAREITYVGPIGSGSVVKLVHNSMAIAMNQVLAEGLTLGVKAGVAPVQLFGALAKGALGNMRVVDRMTKIMARELEPVGFRTGLAEKDVRLARLLATDNGVPIHMIDAAYSDLLEAVNEGLVDLDSICVASIQERRAGISIISAKSDLELALKDDEL